MGDLDYGTFNKFTTELRFPVRVTRVMSPCFFRLETQRYDLSSEC